MAAEAAGYPTVSLVCEGFEGQARATGRGLGFDGLALSVLPGHVDAQSAEEMEKNVLDTGVDQIIAGLTASGTSEVVSDDVAPEPAALDIVASGSIDEINQFFVHNGWSDGLPIIPPTIERIDAMLALCGHDPWKVLGRATSSGRDLTLWSIAVNAVMAGCDPDLLPVLIGVTEILADPAYGAEHSGNTTGADALMIVNGPSMADLGFNAGQGALRDGFAANTSVGRWLRLYLRNVFGFTPDEHDKATFGNSWRVVLSEDPDVLHDIGWEPVASDFGLGIDDDAVTMARFNSGIIVGSVFGSTPEEILPYLGDALGRVSGWDLTHVYGLGQGDFRPLLILSPILARTFSRAGWSKSDLKQALFERARIPARRFEQLVGDWSNLTAGRPKLTELAKAGHVPAAFAESDDPDRLVPIVTEPSKFVVAVAGDPSRTNAYVMSNDGLHGAYTAKRIDRSFSEDLVCRI